MELGRQARLVQHDAITSSTIDGIRVQHAIEIEKKDSHTTYCQSHGVNGSARAAHQMSYKW